MTVVGQLSFTKNALNQYAQKIGKLIDSEVANEESFYADFRDLLKKFFKTDEFEIIIVPKSEETTDKPDFIVYMDNIPIIHIEGKNPYDPVDKWLLADTSNRLFDQVYRFRGREDNNIPVIVTDFIHIWVIDKDPPNSKDSDHQVKLKLKIIDDSQSSWKAFSGIKQKFESALNYVCEDIVLSISKVSSMIPLLVKYAKMLRNEIIKIFKEKTNPMKIYLESIRNDFLESIFSSDKEKKSQEFADLVAQTLVYGGFIAWMRFCKDGNDSNNFSFNEASKYLPYGTFTFNLFIDISTKSTPEIQEKIIAKVERVFQSSQFEKITENTETLMITFYSEFLWQYDPEIAKDRGIVYTPHPIINFIVRGIDYFLKKYFSMSDGIISTIINFLDPAAGTMGFPCEIIRQSKDKFSLKYEKQPGRLLSEFSNWVKNYFLKKTFAFEILMAPYVLGHLRTNTLLDELGANLDPQKDNIKLFLFNTLMELQTTLADFRNPAIGQEIVEALNIRNNKQILVVLSNPPYNVSSQNKYEWIENKINYNPNNEEIGEILKRENKKLSEISELEQTKILNELKKKKNDYFWDLQRIDTKNLSGFKSLQDDYVKFIRFAQWKIKRNGSGIIGYITNRSFIDKLIFRGMRSSLMMDFDKIYIVDLHGDARDGIPIYYQRKGIEKDENVFGIKPGVAISFFIRTPDHVDNRCDICYCESWGSKEQKFQFLEGDIKSLQFNDISKRIDYEFSIDHFDLRDRYLSFIYLVDIFKRNICGCITGNDDFISDVSKSALETKINDFFEGNITVQAKSVDYENAKTKTTKEDSLNRIIKWTYRGFDSRYICYNPHLLMRHGYSLLQYSLPTQNSITLIIERQYGTKNSIGSSVFVTDSVFSHKCNEGASGAGGYAFPLKINESNSDDDYLNPKPATHSNINPEFKSRLSYSNQISDDQIFYYIYGILYSPTYRERYYLGLTEDYPRVPFPNVMEKFLEMSNYGRRLTELHLLKADDLDDTHFDMSLSTDYKIYDLRRKDKDEFGNQIPDTYDPDTKKIYFKKRSITQIKAEKNQDPLNEITWIGDITQDMWDFEIGGRQQLKEWLYARRYSVEMKKNTIQRSLNNDELKYFLKMCDAIKKTIELLPELDVVYKKIDS